MKKIVLVLLMVVVALMNGCGGGTSDTNQQPTAANDLATVIENNSVEIDVAGNDSDSDGNLNTSSIVIISTPAYGEATVYEDEGTIHYRPDTDYEGVDSFTYQIRDNEGALSNEATVNITVEKSRLVRDKAEAVKPKNWYIRIVVEDISRDLKSEDAQLGQLEVENAEKEHSLIALEPRDGFVEVVFRDPAGVEAGDYKSNFHTYQGSDSWDFIVKADNPDADMVISWRGVYVLKPYTDDQGRQRYEESYSKQNPLAEYMKLVDEDSSEEISALKNSGIQRYHFNMNGSTERHFKWIVDADKVGIIVPPVKADLLNKKVKLERLEQTLKPSMDWDNPPEFKVLKR